jgi:hypothetical protein
MRTGRRAIKTQLIFFRSWRENEFVPPTTFAEPLNEDLKQTDIQFQRGSLIELEEITKALTQQLNSVINRLG